MIATDTSASRHVKTWGYWGQSGEPAGLTAQYVASKLTFVEGDAFHASPFKAAGGTYAVRYTDPFRVITSAHEELWDAPESAWYHDASGNRIINGDYASSSGYQNALNPQSPAMVSAYVSLTQKIASSAPYDYVEVDNTYFDLPGLFWGFNARGVEVTSQTDFQNAVNSMLDQLAVRPLLNGLSNADGPNTGVSGTAVAYLNHADGGIDNEGCLQATWTKSVPQWEFEQNTLLYASNAKKWAVCWGRSKYVNDASFPRQFFLGSWWLTYDPTFSVAFPNFSSASNFFVFPEYDIVPLNPVQTAQSHVSELKNSSGVYVREFANCYQAGTPLGPCATFVNPSAMSIALPAHAADYQQALQLDPNNSFDGGKATWVANSATTLAPYSAIVVTSLKQGVSLNPTPTPTPNPTSAPTPTPTPTPIPSPTPTPLYNLTGTVQSVTASAMVVKSPACGYINVSYSSSTPITANGYTLVPGTIVAVQGVGNCYSAPFRAQSITLTGIQPISVSGQVTSVYSNMITVHTSTSCGYINVYKTAATAITGTVAAGVIANVTGTGSCSASITATSITVSQ